MCREGPFIAARRFASVEPPPGPSEPPTPSPAVLLFALRVDRGTGVVEVRLPDGREGELFVVDGFVAAAWCGARSGYAAVEDVLRARGAQAFLRAAVDGGDDTIPDHPPLHDVTETDPSAPTLLPSQRPSRVPVVAAAGR